MLNTTGDPNKNIIPVFEPPDGAQGKKVDLIASPNVVITDLSDADTYRFEIGTYVYLDLTANLVLIAKSSGVTKSVPILKGIVIDRIELTFVYNKIIANQSLSNTGGLSNPTLAPTDTGYIYTGVNVQNNMNITLTGDDGQAQPGSIASDTEGVTFGNLLWLGYHASILNTSASGAEAVIESLQTSVVKIARQYTYFATGGANQKHFVAYPKAWGLATFTKGIFSGGYIRLKNVGGTLVPSTDPGTETDITITNSAGYAEAYYIYESLYDNQNDNVTPFVIS